MDNITLDAYVYCDSYSTPEDVATGVKRPMLSLGERSRYFEREGHLLIGTAKVTLSLYDQRKLHEEKLAALTEMLRRERVSTEIKQNAILEQISKLQAIEHSPT